MMLLMSRSFFAPPFCAHVARWSAASLPSSPECPLTFTHRTMNLRSVAACSSRRHVAIAVAFLICLPCFGGLLVVHMSLVY